MSDLAHSVQRLLF